MNSIELGNTNNNNTGNNNINKKESNNDDDNEKDETCVFLFASPGSGSSTMVNLLSHCNNECTTSGENCAALSYLMEYREAIKKTDNFHKTARNIKLKAAWKKY